LGPALILAGFLAGCMGTIISDDGEGSSTGNKDGNGTGGTGANDGVPEPVDLPGGLTLAGSPKYYRFVRLTHEQWDNAVRDAFGLPATAQWASGFMPDPPAGKFPNNEKALFVSDTLRTDYQRAAEEVAEIVVGDPSALARFGSADDSAGFIRNLGRALFRRPLTSEEENRYGTLFASGKDFYESGNDFADGARIVIEVTEHNKRKASADIEFVDPKNGALLARIDGYECTLGSFLNKSFQNNKLETGTPAVTDAESQ